jgi:1-acyl-sn-glycerol-3-phosphate acyltransferase
MLYGAMRRLFAALIKLLSKPRVEGLENLPDSGAFLIAGNHMSMVDIPLGFAYLGNPNIRGWAAAKWSSHPLFAPIVHIGGGVFIRRGEVDRSSLQEAIDWLKSGKPFALSPEGTRSRNSALQRAKTGAAYLAAEADVMVVPMGIIGTDQAFRTLFLKLRRPELTLRIGRPFKLPPLAENHRSASLRENTDEIMCRIAILLPSRYWGYYAEYPRLQELLEHAETDSAVELDAGTLGKQ